MYMMMTKMILLRLEVAADPIVPLTLACHSLIPIVIVLLPIEGVIYLVGRAPLRLSVPFLLFMVMTTDIAIPYHWYGAWALL